jgi:A/G-specific adenine glycosylase
MLSDEQIADFQTEVLDYYYANKRDLPWRQPEVNGVFDPYKIMVSEIMLQQTQVSRVIEKYHQFIEAFPTVDVLANASLNEVLLLWQGLGYNRRGRFLREAAIKIMSDHQGVMPQIVDELTTLPGIGTNTASAIVVYAHDQPITFIETNIRTVYLHYFFRDEEDVSDSQILSVVEQTIEKSSPRDWYWALMDYGTYIKKEYGNPNVRSKHYTKQSKFEGSKRQVRGAVIRALSERPYTKDELAVLVADKRLDAVLKDLSHEQLIAEKDDFLQIAS